MPPSGLDSVIEKDSGGATIYRDATGSRVYPTSQTDSFGTALWSTDSAGVNTIKATYQYTGTVGGVRQYVNIADSTKTIATNTSPGSFIYQSTLRGYPNGQITLNRTTYTTTIIVGSCFVPTAQANLAQSVNGTCDKVSGVSVGSTYSTAALPATVAGYTKLVRIVVVVQWAGGSRATGGWCHHRRPVRLRADERVPPDHQGPPLGADLMMPRDSLRAALARRLAERLDVRSDAGMTLVELIVAMILTVIAIAVLIPGMLPFMQLVQSSRLQSTSTSDAQIVFERIDSEVRFAEAINQQGYGATAIGNPNNASIIPQVARYVEWLTPAESSPTGRALCTQWRFVPATNAIEERQWNLSSTPPPTFTRRLELAIDQPPKDAAGVTPAQNQDSYGRPTYPFAMDSASQINSGRCSP